jgi:hypothetical protein
MVPSEQMYNQMVEDRFTITYKIIKSRLYPNETIVETMDNLQLQNFSDLQTSYFSETFNHELISIFKQFYAHTFKNIIDQEFRKIKSLCFSKIWVQKYSKGRHEAHIHGNTGQEFSFIWYTKCTDKSSPVVFYNPGWPNVVSHQASIKPENNMLLLFNSFIPHEVLYNEDDNRVAVAGNLKVEWAD